MENEKTIEKIQKLEQKGKVKKILPYAESKKTGIREAAALALGCAYDDDAFNKLKTMLRDPEPSVCICAAGGLKKLGNESAIDHLRYASKNTTDENIKAACNEAAGAIVNSLKR